MCEHIVHQELNVPDNSSFEVEVAYNFFKYALWLIFYVKLFLQIG